MAYERLNLTDHVDNWKAEHVKHLEDGIIALEKAIQADSDVKLVKISDKTTSPYYINGQGEVVESATGAYQWEVTDYVDVSAYDRVAITATAYNGRMYYAFYDENKNYIANSGMLYVSGVSLTDEIVDVPSGAKYCVAMWYFTGLDYDPIIKAVVQTEKAEGAVRFDRVQALEEAEKTTARENIGAADAAQMDAEVMVKTGFTDGYFVNASGGKTVGDSRYAASDFIYVHGFGSASFPGWYSGANAGVATYDKDKNFVRGVTLSGNRGDIQTVTPAEGEYYIRITCLVEKTETFELRMTETANAITKLVMKMDDEAALDDPMTRIIRDGGMTSIFRTIGVVGDSLSAGEMAYGGSTDEFTTKYVDIYDLSWIQFLARACGSTAHNFAQGGLNTRNFLSDLGGHLTNMLDEGKKCQAYFIALGHNDSNYGVDVGTPDDINLDDPTQNADTYYGNYARIISTIKTVEPHAKIFCICMKSSGYAAYNAAIRHMATIFTNVYIIDFETHYPKLETVWEYTEGHGNVMGYLNYSWQIGTYVDWIIRHNRDEFKYVQFIGTNYAQYIP